MAVSREKEQDALNALVQISEMEQERNYVSTSKVKECTQIFNKCLFLF